MPDDRLTGAQLRELYQQALATRGTGRRCATPEAMLAVVKREGSEEERLAVLDHVMGCGACRRELDLLRSIEAAGPAAAPVRKLPWRAVAPFAIAASVLLAVVVTQKPKPDVERGSSEAIVLLAPGPETAGGGPIPFSWQPQPGAQSYRLEVLNEEGGVVRAQSTAHASLTLELPRGSYRWWVKTSTPSGERASALRRLRVQEK